MDWPFPGKGTLDFIPAGRQGVSYGTRVNSFDWADFYDRLGGGAFLDAARNVVTDKYDYILIDSRTGVSDTSGICTIHLPDDLVACFTFNNQSIDGVAAVIESVQHQRGNAPMKIFPVPMRADLNEKEKLETRRKHARTMLGPVVENLVGPEGDVAEYWHEVEVTYVPYYSYEEILATFGDEPGSPASVLGSVERICGKLTDGRIKSMPRIEERMRLETLERFSERGGSTQAVRATGGLEYRRTWRNSDLRLTIDLAHLKRTVTNAWSAVPLLVAVALSVLVLRGSATPTDSVTAATAVAVGLATSAAATAAVPPTVTPEIAPTVAPAPLPALTATPTRIPTPAPTQTPQATPTGTTRIAWTNRQTWSGPSSDVYWVDYNHAGDRAVTADADGTVGIWDVATGQSLQQVDSGLGVVYSASYSPDDSSLLLTGANGRVEIRELDASLSVRAQYVGHASDVLAAAFNGDGSRIATGSYDFTARIWDVATQKELHLLRGHTQVVSDVAFDPVDDRFVATGAWDDTARIWNLDTGDAVTFSGNGGKVWSVAFSPDGTSLFVGGDDGLIRIWSIATGAQIGQLAGHTEGVTSLTFMGGATQLVSTSWDSTARVWGLGRAITSQILPHPDTVVWSAAYNRQNGQIVTSAGDGSARVWATTP